MPTAVSFSDVSKQYRLGEIGTGTLSRDLERAWARLRGKPDPFAKVGVINDRSQAGGEYVWALKDISFDVGQGEVLGVIGRNGAGKSTLLKLLSRVTAPTTGRIAAKGRIASLLEVGTGFHPELTGRENIYLNGAILGMRRNEIKRSLDAIVDFSGCAKYLDTPVKRYSSGMTVRLGFAVAAHLECEILVVDEVLAVGDAEFQRKCIGRMREISSGGGRTVLFVSHNMGTVSQVCNRVAILQEGRIAFTGDPQECISHYLNEYPKGEPSVSRPKQLCEDFVINEIFVASEDNLPNRVFNWDAKVKIRIKYELLEPTKGIEIGVRVKDQRGITVFTTARSHSIDRDLAQGRGGLVVALPPRFLMPGNYSVTIAAHIPHARLLARAEDALTFVIEETGSPHARFKGSDQGVVSLPCTWSDITE